MTTATSDSPAGFLTVQATRITASNRQPETVAVADETPIALVFNGISHAVMMATPDDLENFALGFSLSEGILDDVDGCRDINIEYGAAGIQVQMEIGPSEFARLKDRRRSLTGRTGCGLCGIDSLAALDLFAQPVSRPEWSRNLSFDAVTSAMKAMSGHQPINAHTGGVHAAAWAQPDGTLLKVTEDVGRHNALDKLLGWLAQARRDGDSPVGFVAMSSRASYELIRKCTRLDVPVLAAISAPSSLAITLAAQADLALLAFCRPAGMTVFVP